MDGDGGGKRKEHVYFPPFYCIQPVLPAISQLWGIILWRENFHVERQNVRVFCILYFCGGRGSTWMRQNVRGIFVAGALLSLHADV